MPARPIICGYYAISYIFIDWKTAIANGKIIDMFGSESLALDKMTPGLTGSCIGLNKKAYFIVHSVE